MKSLVIYSTLTGNTKMVAEAVAEVMPNADIFAIENAPNPADYDLVAVGYWVDRGRPDNKTCKWLESLENSKIILFGTLGAYPDSDHAKESMANGEALVKDRGNIVLGSWLCQGKVDPKLLQAMAKMPNAGGHLMTEERKARIEEAKKHPNDQDLENVKQFIRSMLTKVIDIQAEV